MKKFWIMLFELNEVFVLSHILFKFNPIAHRAGKWLLSIMQHGIR